MSVPAVAVVDAKTPGNVGTIARAMKNFGLSELLLVDPPEGVKEKHGEAWGFAGRARRDVLADAREVEFDDLVENYYTVGLTATTNEDCRKHVRFPYSTPAELADDLAELDGDSCIVFGREANGLHNRELSRLDAVCSIPASDEYPVLNLGQAATVTMYELRDLTVEETQLPDRQHERADEELIEHLYEKFEDLLDGIDHNDEKRHKTVRMARRVFGRAHLTERETRTMMGIFRRASEELERGRDLRGRDHER
ncbi:RNA methyltransferase [Haloarchaeobius salinus]|uniref:RNA methyltransferase n=1 Tax=Haloarchaeobius salinus TaxID=1198298 RepID=UPI002108F567|nr:TrmJ/YjtD family RNA methyltransferase [Haloarchaeobius salinus]